MKVGMLKVKIVLPNDNDNTRWDLSENFININAKTCNALVNCLIGNFPKYLPSHQYMLSAGRLTTGM